MVMQSKCFRGEKKTAGCSVKYYIVSRSLADDNMLAGARYIYVSKRKKKRKKKTTTTTKNMLNIAPRCGKEQIEFNMTV